jgi:hypothetical protein
MEQLTKEQAAIIGAYTGFTCGPFADIQEYAERALGRSTWTHEFGNQKFAEELRDLSKADFVALCHVR